MAVIVRPRQPGWQDYLMQAVGQLGTGFINNMFQRDAQAKQADIAKQQMLEKNQMERANMTANIGMLKQAGVPDQMIGAALTKMMGGPDISGMYEHFNPHQQLVETDLGGTKQIGSYNPMQGAYSELANPQVSESPDVIANNKRALQVAEMQKAAQLGAAGISAGASRFATQQRAKQAEMENARGVKPSFGQPQIDAQGNFVQFDQSGNAKQHPIGAQPRGSDNYVAEATKAITAAAPMGVEPDTDPRVQQAMDEVWNRLGVGGESAAPEQPQQAGPAPVAPSMPGRDAQGNVAQQAGFMDFEGVQIPSKDMDITGMRMTPQQYEATKRAYGVTDQDLKDLGVIVEGF